jgi:exodeoxyribonuclease V alpha subunit
MQGGIKVYTGAPARAWRYVEAGRPRADEYYLAEGTGIARRYTATAGRVVERVPMTGRTYEAWVAGLDPDTGVARGRLRSDERAVRCGSSRWWSTAPSRGPWPPAALGHRDGV